MEVDLFAIQPYVSLNTYLSAENFQKKVSGLLAHVEKVRRASYALIAFPEYFCGFLGACGERKVVRFARTMDTALTLIALTKLPQLLHLKRRFSLRNLQEAFLFFQAKKSVAIFSPLFANMAGKHHAYILIGTALLPARDALNGSNCKGSIFNTAIVFSPQGEIVSWTKKVNLVPGVEDILFLTPGREEEIAPFSTPFGKVGVSICYDGFCAPHTRYEQFQDVPRKLDREGAAILIQPSANSWEWEKPWAYGNAQEALKRKRQWHTEGLDSQLSSFHSVRAFLNPMLHGDLLDLHFDGRSSIWQKNSHWTKKVSARSAKHSQEILHWRATL